MSGELIVKISQEALNAMSPLLGRLMQIILGSAEHAEQTANTGTIDDLRAEAERQDLTLRMAERQAKVAQELALARRIESADYVEMEEFYDVSGSGHVGVKAGDSGVSAGFGGQGQKVMRRVYRFKSNVGSKEVD